MLKKICAIACMLILGVSVAHASRSTYNPMVPRQLKIESAQKDYSYGYSILSGNAIDTLEVPNRVVGWTLNYEIFGMLNLHFLYTILICSVNISTFIPIFHKNLIIPQKKF